MKSIVEYAKKAHEGNTSDIIAKEHYDKVKREYDGGAFPS